MPITQTINDTTLNNTDDPYNDNFKILKKNPTSYLDLRIHSLNLNDINEKQPFISSVSFPIPDFDKKSLINSSVATSNQTSQLNFSSEKNLTKTVIKDFNNNPIDFNALNEKSLKEKPSISSLPSSLNSVEFNELVLKDVLNEMINLPSYQSTFYVTNKKLLEFTIFRQKGFEDTLYKAKDTNEIVFRIPAPYFTNSWHARLLEGNVPILEMNKEPGEYFTTITDSTDSTKKTFVKTTGWSSTKREFVGLTDGKLYAWKGNSHMTLTSYPEKTVIAKYRSSTKFDLSFEGHLTINPAGFHMVPLIVASIY
ncbi:hypothetical protein HK099_000506, partial [Clydaea vesicula]